MHAASATLHSGAPWSLRHHLVAAEGALGRFERVVLGHVEQGVRRSGAVCVVVGLAAGGVDAAVFGGREEGEGGG